MMTVREEQVLCKLHEFIDANDINCAEDVTQREILVEAHSVLKLTETSMQELRMKC